MMQYLKKISSFVFLLTVILIFSECSATRSNPYYAKRTRASSVNTLQLGRNRYYFSNSYQKKLNKSYKSRYNEYSKKRRKR